jgi:hypothetical protein
MANTQTSPTITLRAGQAPSVSQALRRRLDAFTTMLASYQVVKAPYSEQDIAQFDQLPSDKQMALYSKVERYTEVYFVASQQLVAFDDNVKMLRLFMKMNGLSAPQGFEDVLTSGTVEEIYDTELVQEYGNLEFFRLCNYPVLKVLMMPFNELYYRDPVITNALVDRCREVLTASEYTHVVGTPTHLMRELSSDKKEFFEIVNLYAFAMKNSDGETSHLFCNQLATLSSINKNVEIIY